MKTVKSKEKKAKQIEGPKEVKKTFLTKEYMHAVDLEQNEITIQALKRELHFQRQLVMSLHKSLEISIRTNAEDMNDGNS